MVSFQRQPSRPPTVWCDGTPDWTTSKRPTHSSAPSSRSQSDPAVTSSAKPINNPSAMVEAKAQTLHDCAILAIISIFGLSYFYLFMIHFLLFHFPSSPGEILDSLSVLVYCAGVILWCLSSLVYRILYASHGSDAAEWQKLELGGILVLIWTTTIPSVVLLFRAQPSLQLGYLAAFTVVAVGTLVDFLVWDPRICAARYRFPYSCISLGLLSLIPTIHTLTGTFQTPPLLAVHFGRVAIWNSLGAVFYLLRPLERMGVVNGWRPSLYVMHLVLAYSAVTYSRVILHTVLEYAA
ncbi:Hly-III-related protein [Penicillium freii]|nr:Hly-III-related protein [Penicillium freii]